MKKLLLALLILGSTAKAYNDRFWGNTEELKTISDQMIIAEGVDMAEFHENFSKTTAELRKAYVKEAVDLMKAGASGGEALEMILAFDDRVYDRRKIAKRGMGTTIAEHFKSGMNMIYDSFEDQGGDRRIEFTSSTYAKYKARLLWGVKPQAGVYAILKLTDTDTNISRSFASRANFGQIEALGRSLAFQMFHSLHKTRFPMKTKVNGKNLKFNGIKNYRTTGYVQYNTMLRAIDNNCRALNKRLPTRQEMRYLFARGFYNKGVNRGNAIWAADDNYIMDGEYPLGRKALAGSSPTSRTIRYICVEEEKSTYRW